MYYYIIKSFTREIVATAATQEVASVIAAHLTAAFGHPYSVVWYGDWEEPDAAGEPED